MKVNSQIPPSNCLQSSISPPLPKGSVCWAQVLLLTEGKVKDFTGSQASVKLQGLIESHLEPPHSAPPKLTPLLKTMFQLLRVYNQHPFKLCTAGLIPKRAIILCLNETRGVDSNKEISVSPWLLQKDPVHSLLKLLPLMFWHKLVAPQAAVKLCSGMLMEYIRVCVWVCVSDQQRNLSV